MDGDSLSPARDTGGFSGAFQQALGSASRGGCSGNFSSRIGAAHLLCVGKLRYIGLASGFSAHRAKFQDTSLPSFNFAHGSTAGAGARFVNTVRAFNATEIRDRTDGRSGSCNELGIQGFMSAGLRFELQRATRHPSRVAALLLLSTFLTTAGGLRAWKDLWLGALCSFRPAIHVPV